MCPAHLHSALRLASVIFMRPQADLDYRHEQSSPRTTSAQAKAQFLGTFQRYSRSQTIVAKLTVKAEHNSAR
jgi:hypothetical protein